MCAELFHRAAMPVEHARQDRHEGTFGRDERQQHELGQPVVGLDAIEERDDRGFRLLAVDQRGAERRIRMGPAGERREHAIAALDARREQPDQPLRHRFRPHQHGAGIGPNTRAAGSAKAGS